MVPIASSHPRSTLQGTILIADDDEFLCRGLQRILRRHTLDVQYETDSRKVLNRIKEIDPDVVLIDFMMPFQNGVETVRQLRDAKVGAEVVMMTAHPDNAAVVVDAMREGVYRFLHKPLEHDTLRMTIEKAIALRHIRVRARKAAPDPEAQTHNGTPDIVGKSAAMAEIFETIDRVAPTSSTVLVTGESGTGKELVARAIHERSARSSRNFVTVNCAAIPADLIESELFGHVRGAFSGALRERAGLFESASGGTIFLDEIGDMPLAAQAKLLRVLQEGELKRVGADETRTVDVRVIAATNVDLARRVVEGSFRRDLYYRLNVITLNLPALRERPEDIPLLVDHFLRKLSRRLHRAQPIVDPSAMQALCAYVWPGNVRELEHVIERALVLSTTGVIMAEDLSIVASESKTQRSIAIAPYAGAKELAIRDFDRTYVLTVLGATNGNISAAARLAGIDRTNFRRLMRRAGVTAQALQKPNKRR